MDFFARNKFETPKRIAIMIFAGFTGAFALNVFLIPANVFAAGINGIAQLLSGIFQTDLKLHIDTGYLILLFNIPIGILGYIKIGRQFTFLSFGTSALTSLFAILLPTQGITDNPLMNAIVGGVITGVGVGLAMKFGFSTGGTDIISLVLVKTTGKTVGSLMFAINLLIILIAGFYFGWESALYTIISIYCMTRVIDSIHTSHQKVTAMIVTQLPQEVIKNIHEQLIRGITIIPSKGAYFGAESSVLMIVINRYELYDLEQATKRADTSAFINILNTVEVVGEFLDQDQQKKKRNSAKNLEVR